MDDASLARARASKPKLSRAIRDAAEVVGIGLTTRGDDVALKVNLRSPRPPGLPDTVGGVPVIYEVIGRVTRRAG